MIYRVVAICIFTIIVVIHGYSNVVEDRKDLVINQFLVESLDPDSYIHAVDLDKPVYICTIKKGDILIQYQTPNSPQGNFYAFSASSPSKLGISENGWDPILKKKVKKEIRYYVAIKDTTALASYANPIIDSWSTPGFNIKTEGHELQIFTSCKGCFSRHE